MMWLPSPRQKIALSSPVCELFYGGAAGGGKTDFLIADFLKHLNEWGDKWNGILFRKTYPELEGIIRRSLQIYPLLGARFKSGDKVWEFPNGARLALRHLDNEYDVTHYQGHEFTWIGFDELGNYPTSYCWTYMMSRARSSAGAPCYLRGTGNPGGKGHGWLKQRFIDGKKPMTVYAENGIKRIFIPANIDDNQILLMNDPLYRKRLENLPEHLRRALLHGDWDVFEGQIFAEFRRDRHVVKPFPLPPDEWKRFYAFDWGFHKPFAVGKWAVNSEGRFVQYGEWYGCKAGEWTSFETEVYAPLRARVSKEVSQNAKRFA
jgi:hypothetical protein